MIPMVSSVLYISPALPVGGLEKLIVRISALLAEKKTVRQYLVSLSDNNPISAEFDRSVEFFALPRKSKFHLAPVRRLRKLIREKQPEVIICLNFFSFLFAYLGCLGMKNKPRIFVFYQTTIHLNRKEFNLHKFYFSLLSKRDKVIAASVNQVNYTVETYGVSREFFEIIYNGVNTEYFTVPSPGWDRAAFRSQYGIPAGAKTIVMAAALRPEKNHTGALEALQILESKYHITAYLLIAGGGVMEQEIREHIKKRKLEDRAVLAGVQKDVRPVFWASDLFTLCSTSVETFSVAALEAMACGLPCVLTDIGGAREMISEGITGHVCDTSAEDIAAAWAKTLTEQYCAADIHKYIAANFSEPKMMNEYERIISEK